MSFRVLTPIIGIKPANNMDLDIFMSYSMYSYGENVKLRPNQISGDPSAIEPDDHAVKIQAQISW